jgi:3-methyladenine DNA glycosylase/8-oxoguanine DNA glycosylase
LAAGTLDEPPTTAELDEISQRWRPYRTWVTLLLRTWLEDETGEISGRRPVGSPYPT